MPILLLILAVGVFGYFIWRARTSSLSRDCRWREHRKQGVWICAFCGAQTNSAEAPTQCLRGTESPDQ